MRKTTTTRKRKRRTKTRRWPRCVCRPFPGVCARAARRRVVLTLACPPQEESLDEIDPSVIQPRRTRGVRVDYTSPEALAKAGIKPEEAVEDDEEETYEAKDDEMKDD